jgi:hypothetical protein
MSAAKKPSAPSTASVRRGWCGSTSTALQLERSKKDLADRLAAEKQDRIDKAADRARRKKEGVRIGMSQEDVLSSSWGRPERVNRTTYSFGTHEQWVYGNSQYLYFENGVLKTIQNSR